MVVVVVVLVVVAVVVVVVREVVVVVVVVPAGKIKIFCTLIKKKIKFPSYIRKFKVEQLQSHT